jgi:hypothetical protein
MDWCRGALHVTGISGRYREVINARGLPQGRQDTEGCLSSLIKLLSERGGRIVQRRKKPIKTIFLPNSILVVKTITKFKP